MLGDHYQTIKLDSSESSRVQLIPYTLIFQLIRVRIIRVRPIFGVRELIET